MDDLEGGLYHGIVPHWGSCPLQAWPPYLWVPHLLPVFRENPETLNSALKPPSPLKSASMKQQNYWLSPPGDEGRCVEPIERRCVCYREWNRKCIFPWEMYIPSTSLCMRTWHWGGEAQLIILPRTLWGPLHKTQTLAHASMYMLLQTCGVPCCNEHLCVCMSLAYFSLVH